MRNVFRDWSVGRSKGPRTEINNLVFSPMPPSEGLKMLVSTMMTGHDDENHVDGPYEMATWDVSRALFSVKVACGFTHIHLKDMSKRVSWPDFAGACIEREMQR